MSAIDIINNIVDNEYLVNHPFKYCLVTETKLPYTINDTLAHPNKKEDFCTLQELLEYRNLSNFEGVGISIVESKISAIDIDKCFATPFDINTGDARAQDILETFKDKAYIEFSFSGRGLRIFFVVDDIKDYTKKYYIKNAKTQIEYYQPGNSARYVTITGKTIYNNSLHKMKNLDDVEAFLNKYMLRPQKSPRTINTITTDDRPVEELMKFVKDYYLKDFNFQNLWFKKAPGSNSNESELDFQMIMLLHDNITSDKEKLRLIFEQSPYFKSKDYKHKNKWNYNNYRYYNYIYDRLK